LVVAFRLAGFRVSNNSTLLRLVGLQLVELEQPVEEQWRINVGTDPCSSWALIRVGLVLLVQTLLMTRLLRLVLAALMEPDQAPSDNSNRIRVGVVS
jgi:hypothetical protein